MLYSQDTSVVQSRHQCCTDKTPVLYSQDTSVVQDKTAVLYSQDSSVALACCLLSVCKWICLLIKLFLMTISGSTLAGEMELVLLKCSPHSISTTKSHKLVSKHTQGSARQCSKVLHKPINNRGETFPLRQSRLTDTKVRVGRLFRDSVNPEAVIVLHNNNHLGVPTSQSVVVVQ